MKEGRGKNLNSTSKYNVIKWSGDYVKEKKKGKRTKT